MDENNKPVGRAERAYREAFERLKQGKPVRLPPGAEVHKKNIAIEAGKDPSALKRKRFPSLVAEAENYCRERKGASTESPRQLVLAKRDVERGKREQAAKYKAERDEALSLLVEAEACIVDQAAELRSLKLTMPPSNVRPLRRP